MLPVPEILLPKGVGDEPPLTERGVSSKGLDLYFYPHLRTFFSSLLGREGGREGGREKHRELVASHMYQDQGSNL